MGASTGGEEMRGQQQAIRWIVGGAALAAAIVAGALAGDLAGLAAALVGAAAGLLLGRRAAGPAEPSADPHVLARELDRARRLGTDVTLVRLPGAAALAPAAVEACRAGGPLRAVDSSWTEGDDLFLVLVDTADEGARRVIDRVGGVGIPVEGARLASFPAAGLTTGALLAKVHDGDVVGGLAGSAATGGRLAASA